MSERTRLVVRWYEDGNEADRRVFVCPRIAPPWGRADAMHQITAAVREAFAANGLCQPDTPIKSPEDGGPVVDPDAGLVPPLAMAAVKRVLASGARKYADFDDGTREDTRDKGHHMGKAHGHWGQYISGERVDEDSGESPLAHAAARLMLALELELRGKP